MSNQIEVDIYNSALDELGQDPIDAFDDETPAGEVAGRRFARVSGYALGRRVWSFQRTVVQLSQLAAAPGTGYDHAYAIPGADRVLSVFRSLEERDRPLREGWRVYKGQVHSNEDTLWAEVPVTAGAEIWPEYFRELMVKALAASACMQHTGNSRLKRDLTEEAWGAGEDYPNGGLFGVAVGLDGQDGPDDRMEVGPGPLIMARF